MKIRITTSILALLFAPLPVVLSQGPLTPPGPPAPNMRSLDQIEARTPISSLPFSINIPGSYYLTQNLSVSTGDAITISVSNVTLDLNGFTISSTASPASGSGILIARPGTSDVTILNGHIKGGVTYSGSSFGGPGFVNGILAPGALSDQPSNVLVTRVSVSGCLGAGIYLGRQNSIVVDSCVVQVVGSNGIFASTVTRSSVRTTGGAGIAANVVSDTYAISVGGGIAIYSNTASNCYGISDASAAISSNTAINCRGESTSAPGISADNVTNCWGFSASSQGIFADMASNCYGQSNVNRGISVNVAIACSGRSYGGSYGLFATSLASSSYGFSNSGTGLNAPVVVACSGGTNTGFPLAYNFHYNMPP